MIPLNIDSLASVWRQGLFNLLHVTAGKLKKMCKIAMNSIHDISWLLFSSFRSDRKQVRWTFFYELDVSDALTNLTA